MVRVCRVRVRVGRVENLQPISYLVSMDLEGVEEADYLELVGTVLVVQVLKKFDLRQRLLVKRFFGLDDLHRHLLVRVAVECTHDLPE